MKFDQLANDYAEKEAALMKLIVENTDNDTVEVMKKNNEAVREYLKGKENEIEEHSRHDTGTVSTHKARKSGALKSAKSTVI